MSDRPAFLISLPSGLVVSGVVVWAVRAVNELARRGRGAGLIVHPADPGYPALEPALHPGVRFFDLRSLGSLRDANGDLSGWEPAYASAVHELAAGDKPVVLAPNLHGDSYGLAASMTARDARVRVIGFQHSDIEYDSRVLLHYSEIIAAFVGVSAHIAQTLRARLGHRADRVRELAYGVPVVHQPAERTDLASADGSWSRPIRIIYQGRMEQEQKRAFALVELARALIVRDVPFEMTLLGDGPIAAEIDRRLAQLPPPQACATVRRLPGQSPERIGAYLDRADVFVLPSRYEGLSIAMLEAMGRGCVPIVAKVASGADQAVRHGQEGVLVPVADGEEMATIGAAFADAIVANRSRVQPMSRLAWRRAATEFSITTHTDRLEAILDDAAAEPARRWPDSTPFAFSARGPGGSGSVPADGASRLAAALAGVREHRIVVHGTGRHTTELRTIFEQAVASGLRLVGFSDDDPARWGQELWGLPIVEPAAAAGLGAEIVVLSTWMHEDAVWDRRAVYETRGLQVVRLYNSRLNA